MSIDAQLQELLREPQERLDAELKGWLDLNANDPRGTLAKALLALANHGGGFVIIGLEEGLVSTGRHRNLDGYSQDVVNDVVDRFADPGFHCTVQHVVSAADGLAYPIIIVPGGHRVPIRSKRGSSDNEIQADRYYVRRPGPASEPPQTGREWDELLRRSIRNGTEEIASLLHDVLEGRPPKAEAKPGVAARLEEWQGASIARWKELINGLPKDHPARLRLGWYSVSYVVEGVDLSLDGLWDALHAAERERFTGWPPWWLPNRPEIAPYVEGDTIECWIGGKSETTDTGHADFWRASTTGEMFLVRGYIEDALANRQGAPKIDPGTSFDLTLPVWRVGECLLHAAWC